MSLYSKLEKERKPLKKYYDNLITYGPYITVTKGVYLFKAEQHINLGVRLPVQPYFRPEDTELFLSIDVPIMPELMVFGEVVNIRFPFKKWIDETSFPFEGKKWQGVEELQNNIDIFLERAKKYHSDIL